VNSKRLNLCCGKKRTLLKNKSPVLINYFKGTVLITF